jgi:hypothetical protein
MLSSLHSMLYGLRYDENFKVGTTAYFRNDFGTEIKAGSRASIVAKISTDVFQVIPVISTRIYTVHGSLLTYSKKRDLSATAIGSLDSTAATSRRSPAKLSTHPGLRGTAVDGQPSRSTSSHDNGRRTMEEIRASFDGMSVSTLLPTEDVTLISHAHGRQRRAERDIQRIDLQRAIKHGTKEYANPGRDGSDRWRYTHNGVVYITDETSRHEVTSWRVDGEDEEEGEVATAEVELAGSGCHAVLIIDNSGSMRTPDVPGYKTRAHAVYECLKRDFVKEQLKTGAASDVVVTLISMSNDASVLFHTQPLNDSLIDQLETMSKRKPKSHGNYIPALDKALEVMRADAPNRSSLLLLFFSDGAPSDQQGMKCEHNVQLFAIDRKVDPKMQHNSKGSSWNCRKRLFEKVEKECCQRVKSMGKVFGRDKMIFRTLAFGPPKENFSLMEKMADVLPRGEFQKLGLDASSLKTSFSSLSSSLLTLRTESGHRALTRRLDKVVDKNQRVDNSVLHLQGAKGWWIYAFSDFIGKYLFEDGRFKLNLWDVDEAGRSGGTFTPGSNGVAFHRDPFAEGAERFVYRCREIYSMASDYNCAASDTNVAWRVGLRLVAKEAKDLENHHQGRKFHETFARIQYDAGKQARAFTGRLPNPRPDWTVTFIETVIYGCYDNAYRLGEAWILVEPELDGKFTKWNNNAGEVRGRTSTQARSSGIGSMALLEESDDEEEMAPIEVDDIPQAFSHFSYEHSAGKQLVCDLQGVWNADDGFVLTDPVVHYVSSKGRAHTNGATDKGLAGVKRFFETHVCCSLCKKMGLPPRTPSNLIRRVWERGPRLSPNSL